MNNSEKVERVRVGSFSLVLHVSSPFCGEVFLRLYYMRPNLALFSLYRSLLLFIYFFSCSRVFGCEVRSLLSGGRKDKGEGEGIYGTATLRIK